MNRKGGNVKDEEDKGGERRIGKEEPQDEGKKNAVALKKNRVKQKLDLPPGQRPVKEMSVPQSLVCLHVPCRLPRVHLVPTAARASRASRGFAAVVAAKRERRMGRESCMVELN